MIIKRIRDTLDLYNKSIKTKNSTRTSSHFFFIKEKYFSSRLETFPFDIDIDSHLKTFSFDINIDSFTEFELASQKSSSDSIISTLKSSSDSEDANLIYHINKIIDI